MKTKLVDILKLTQNIRDFSQKDNITLKVLAEIDTIVKDLIKKEFTEDQLKEIITKAFDDGELWGVTYSGWFTPSEERYKKVLSDSQEEILKGLKK